VPRQELCPEKRFLIEPMLTKVKPSRHGSILLIWLIHFADSCVLRARPSSAGVATDSRAVVSAQVIGSTPLEVQVRRLQSDLHLFGHTHIPIDMAVDELRWAVLSWPCLYIPKKPLDVILYASKIAGMVSLSRSLTTEGRHRPSLEIADSGVPLSAMPGRYMQWPLGSVGEQKRQCVEMAGKGPLLIFDDAKGLAPTVPTKWGDHYRANPRDVLQVELAPWVRAFWKL
jgi:hypothetical protein